MKCPTKKFKVLVRNDFVPEKQSVSKCHRYLLCFSLPPSFCGMTLSCKRLNSWPSILFEISCGAGMSCSQSYLHFKCCSLQVHLCTQHCSAEAFCCKQSELQGWSVEDTIVLVKIQFSPSQKAPFHVLFFCNIQNTAKVDGSRKKESARDFESLRGVKMLTLPQYPQMFSFRISFTR